MCILAKRLVEEAHRLLQHGGSQLCTQYLRNKYWIVHIRKLTRKVTQGCIVCCRYKQIVGNQMMADLPKYRLQPTPVFENSGIDFAGPIPVKLTRNTTGKAYIAVFICMVYKTIHLELVNGLDANSVIASLTRFVSLRAGNVRRMYSDNGRNFVGANRILKEAYELIKDNTVCNFLTNHKIEWFFNHLLGSSS